MGTPCGGRRRSGAAGDGPDAFSRGRLGSPEEAAFSVDERGAIQSLNEAAERVFGYAAREVLGRNVSLLVGAPGRERAPGAAPGGVIDGGLPGAGRELTGRRKDGSTFPMELLVGELALGGRRLRVGFVRDVSERRSHEQELLQAHKLEAVGSLANGIAHDFNNLLMGILACSRIARKELDGNPAARELLGEIGDAAHRGIGLTRQILSFTRGVPEATAPTSLDEVVRASQAMLRPLLGEDVEIVADLDARGAHVLASAGLIEQVLVNLLVNARDAMPCGGEIAVSTRGEGERVVLEVRDRGCGIPDDVRARIFEPFFTTKEPGKGTGLGLATVKSIVDRLGGTIEVESAPGRGSTFRLRFPSCASPAEPSASTALPARAPEARKTVLLVEDDRLVRVAVRRHLEGRGFRVLAAAGPSEAVAAACANPSIHALVTDVILPGSGGNELAQEIRSRVPGVPVVFMSGYGADFLARERRLAPGHRCLQKPFELEELDRALDDAVAEARAARRRPDPRQH